MRNRLQDGTGTRGIRSVSGHPDWSAGPAMIRTASVRRVKAWTCLIKAGWEACGALRRSSRRLGDLGRHL